ncbi:MAG: ATP-binding protein [Prevotella sp.]|nr:ATP-binding protein [Prevotella sp.]MBQ9223040.1 ATP-binding protein [Prevotella sp.]
MVKKPFIYGMSVEGEHFTDRDLETKRLQLNFEHGVNSILISPRRMGKTSLVKKVKRLTESPTLKIVYMDIYKCRSEYDFYEKYASAIIQETATKMERMVENAKEFLMGVTPKIVFSPDMSTDFTLSLGVNPQTASPEEILDLPERIARKRHIQIVVCIDEFQQIGEMPDSLILQKTIRSVWQHHQHTSYCLFGSKQHLMSNLFYSRKMPFYQFGDMFFLKKIPMDKWVPFIISRFETVGKTISESLAEKICTTVDNYSAYVQQLAWNVLAVTDKDVDDQSFNDGLDATLAQVSPLYVEQMANLSSYQLNFIRAICAGYHGDFGKQEVTRQYNLGTRSNLAKLQKALIEREIIEITESGIYLADPLFAIWFKREMM